MIHISIILPCLNEATILKKSVNEIKSVLNKTNYNYEIIISEDGSTDGTDKIARKLTKKDKSIIYLHSNKRLGRGKGVKIGIKKAKGKIVGFIDTDLQTPAYEIPRLIKEVEKGYDFVIGKRIYKKDIGYYYRMIPSFIYIYFLYLLFNIKLDTLSGCKFFNRKKILPILNKVQDPHWFWDTEIVLVARYNNLKIREINTTFLRKIEKGRKSKAKLINDSLNYFKNLILFKIRTIKEYKK